MSRQTESYDDASRDLALHFIGDYPKYSNALLHELSRRIQATIEDFIEEKELDK